MNILLSAYSVNPYMGSEDAVGWNWTTTLSKKLPDSTIYLLTKKFNAEDAEKGIKEFGLSNVKLVIVDVPNCLNWFREKHSAFHHMYYVMWQKCAYRWAKNCGIHFDIVHHVSMGNYRITGHMYKLENTYSIFGPVGGGQTTPKALKCYYKTQKFYEDYRDLVSKLIVKLPRYKKQLKSFDKLYAVNDETKNALEKASGRECCKLCDIAISEDLSDLNIEHKNKKTIEIIYLGRFIELKGIMLLIDVIKNISSKQSFHLSLYGSGELEKKIKRKISEYKLDDLITVAGNVDHTKVSEIYKNADIFVHPTFRDSSGAVFVEAMAHKLPIVSLNQSISRDLNKNKCGLFVNTQQDKESIINEFASKLTTLIENYDLRLELGENGYRYANNELTLENKFNTIYGEIINQG